MTRKMKKRNVELFASRSEEREFPRGERGLIFCNAGKGGCGAVYFNKSWHHSVKNLKKIREDAPVLFRLCPACAMIKNRQFEGRVVIKNFPAKFEKELFNFVRGFGERARFRDPLDRIIDVKKTREGVVITTTENELASKLARKIKQQFVKIKSKISFSPAPGDTVYIAMEFLF